MAREKCVAGSNPVLLLGPDRVIKLPQDVTVATLQTFSKYPSIRAL